MNDQHPSRPHGTHNLPQGAALVITASAVFSLMGAAIKAVSVAVPLEMVVFFRNFFGLVILLPWLSFSGRAGFYTQRPGLHLFRACSGLAAMYCFFYTLKHLQLGEAVLLNFSAPLFIPLMAWFWLGERLHPGVGWALALGLMGITLILKPTAGIITPVAWIGVASGIFAALALVSVKRMADSEPPERIVLYFAAMGTLVSALPLAWSWSSLAWSQWGTLFGIGALASLGQVLLTRGIVKTAAGQVGPFSYSSVVFSALIGWLAWGEMLDAMSLVGGVFVCLGGILALRGDRTSRGLPGT